MNQLTDHNTRRKRSNAMTPPLERHKTEEFCSSGRTTFISKIGIRWTVALIHSTHEILLLRASLSTIVVYTAIQLDLHPPGLRTSLLQHRFHVRCFKPLFLSSLMQAKLIHQHVVFDPTIINSILGRGTLFRLRIRHLHSSSNCAFWSRSLHNSSLATRSLCASRILWWGPPWRFASWRRYLVDALLSIRDQIRTIWRNNCRWTFPEDVHHFHHHRTLLVNQTGMAAGAY